MSWKCILRSVLCAAMLPCLRAAAQEDFVLRSQASSSDVTRLAILPFSGAESIPDIQRQARPEEIVRADLSYSGRFDLVQLASGGDAARSGAAMLVEGSVHALAGGDVEIRCELLDAASRQVLAEKTYSGRPRDLRRLVHRFSDDIVFQVYGERGIASTRIAYVQGKPGHKEIWAMDYDGFNAGPLTKNGSINLAPVFDRDGSLIWISFQGGNGARAWKQTPGGKAKLLIPSLGGTHSSVTVSSVDGEIAIAASASGQSQIYRTAPGGGSPTRLTYNDAIQTSPSWSATGWELAFTSDRTGHPQIYVMDREGSSVRRLTYKGGYNDQAAWSPDGSLIAFGRLAGDWQVLTIRPDGSGEQVIASGRNPKWSPDGRHLVYMVEWQGRSDIWTCNPDGTGRRQLTHGGTAALPTWSP